MVRAGDGLYHRWFCTQRRFMLRPGGGDDGGPGPIETIVVLALFPSVGWDGAEEPATRINVGVEELVTWFPGVGYSQPWCVKCTKNCCLMLSDELLSTARCFLVVVWGITMLERWRGGWFQIVAWLVVFSLSFSTNLRTSPDGVRHILSSGKLFKKIIYFNL